MESGVRISTVPLYGATPPRRAIHRRVHGRMEYRRRGKREQNGVSTEGECTTIN